MPDSTTAYRRRTHVPQDRGWDKGDIETTSRRALFDHAFAIILRSAVGRLGFPRTCQAATTGRLADERAKGRMVIEVLVANVAGAGHRKIASASAYPPQPS